MNIALEFKSDSNYGVFVSFSDPQLFPGAGVHRLQLTAKIDKNTAPLNGLITLHGHASVTSSTRSPLWLGNWVAGSPNYIRTIPDSGEHVNLPLSDEQLWRIEDFRRGDNLTLRLDVNATLSHAGAVYQMINPVQYTLFIDRDVWLRNLDQIELVNAFMVAAQTPSVGDSGTAAIGRVLRAARVAHNDNRPRDAVVDIRKGLERLKSLISNLPTEKQIADTPARQRSEAQRWALLLHALYGIANAAPHEDEVTEKIEFDRRDSQAIIATAIGLVGRRWD